MAQTLTVKNTSVSVIKVGNEDFLSLTDIARFKSDEPNAVIANWLRNRNTIEYLGIWESLYNPDFKPLEFEGFKKAAWLVSKARAFKAELSYPHGCNKAEPDSAGADGKTKVFCLCGGS